MSFETRVIIPVKRLEESKTSFSDLLSPEERERFTLKMLADVIKALKSVKGAKTTVLTPDNKVIEFVDKYSVDFIKEPDLGLNRSLEMAIGESINSGFEEVLIIPSDLPLIKSEDIIGVMDLASGERSVVIAPSEENGTNALLLRPPDVIDLQFGGESFPEHVREAKSRGITPEIYRSKRIERDMDVPSNLLKLETRGIGTETQDFLESFIGKISER